MNNYGHFHYAIKNYVNWNKHPKTVFVKLDEKGLLSCREFFALHVTKRQKRPGIKGTSFPVGRRSIATRDGDLVEVDEEKGAVEVLDRPGVRLRGHGVPAPHSWKLPDHGRNRNVGLCQRGQGGRYAGHDGSGEEQETLL